MEIREVVTKHLEDRLRSLNVAYANLTAADGADNTIVVLKGLSLEDFENEIQSRVKARTTEVLKSCSISRGGQAIFTLLDMVVLRIWGILPGDISDRSLINKIDRGGARSPRDVGVARGICVGPGIDKIANDLGTKYPIYHLSEISETKFTMLLRYKEAVSFDINNPKCFDQLDLSMDHILIHDDLLGLSV
jgi:hypothetical protein